MTYTPTPRQSDLLAFIGHALKKTGAAPTYEEMCKALGLRSKSGIHRLIIGLEERGQIHRLPNRARSVALGPRPAVAFKPLEAFCEQARACLRYGIGVDRLIDELSVEHHQHEVRTGRRAA